MRFRPSGPLWRWLCFAGSVLIAAAPADAIDADKPLIEYTHTVWTRKDGIPSAFIDAIAQTPDGYLWLATADGLVRFDGVRFVHWRPKTGHTALLGVVRSLCVARDGSLWIGTAAGLVGQIRGDDLTALSVGAPAEALLVDRDGTLWVTMPHQLLRFAASTRQPIGRVITLPGSVLSGPIQHRSGAIWLSTDRGVMRVDADNQAHPLVMADGPAAWLSADTSGAIWATGSDGTTRAVPADTALTPAATAVRHAINVQTVLRDSRGDTWIGTLGQGLARLRATSRGAATLERFSPADGLSADSVWCVFEDREHNIWVGTQNGLNRLRDEKVRTLINRERLTSGEVVALAAAPDGSVWASTTNGLDRIDGGRRETYGRGARVAGVHVDGTNTVWAGTDHGVARLQDRQWSALTWARQLTAVTVITGDETTGLWLFDERKGLHRWKDGALTDFSNEVLGGKAVRAAETDDTGRVWFGLYGGGVIRYGSNGFHVYGERDGLAGGSVNAVHIDDANQVWVASEQGLSRLDGARFVTWDRSNGLPGERVLWVLTDTVDQVLLGYSTGVARLARAELDQSLRDRSYSMAFQFLDEADGLKGNPDRRSQSAAVRAKDQRLWFRTSEGVAIVDASHLVGNVVPPPVHIEHLVADGVEIDTTRPVRLRSLTRDVEIDYTALSLAEPRNVRFRYMLEGFDPEWRNAGARREAFYTNLRPRAYRFRVLASNNDGVWNDTGAGVDFIVLPAFYQTRTFLLVCAFAAMTISWSTYRLRVWQLTNRLRDRFDERLKERTRIAQDLHDSLIQDVMGISLQIELSEALLPAEVRARQPLDRALQLCKSALDAGRRALRELRAVPLSAADLTDAFSRLSVERATESGPRLDVVIEGRERALSPLAGNDVLQIGRQAIANAFQHAHAKDIHVLVSYGAKDLRLRVLDNGCGMTMEELTATRDGH
ncbi:MAG: two-component system sensor kinase, partial [Acidobacteria bacterium]|nr:two-component system sensor kinase [Acidobacteriota bacterium]